MATPSRRGRPPPRGRRPVLCERLRPRGHALAPHARPARATESSSRATESSCARRGRCTRSSCASRSTSSSSTPTRSSCKVVPDLKPVADGDLPRRARRRRAPRRRVRALRRRRGAAARLGRAAGAPAGGRAQPRDGQRQSAPSRNGSRRACSSAPSDDRFLRLARFLLTRNEFEVESTKRIAKTVDLVERHHPNVVVIDATDSLADAARAVAAIEALHPHVAVIVVYDGEPPRWTTGLKVDGEVGSARDAAGGRPDACGRRAELGADRATEPARDARARAASRLVGELPRSWQIAVVVVERRPRPSPASRASGSSGRAVVGRVLRLGARPALGDRPRPPADPERDRPARARDLPRRSDRALPGALARVDPRFALRGARAVSAAALRADGDGHGRRQARGADGRRPREVGHRRPSSSACSPARCTPWHYSFAKA